MNAMADALRRRALGAFVVGAAALAAGVLLALLCGGSFWLPYLFAVHLCLGLGLGAAGILMTHHLTGGRWGYCLLRPLQAMTATVPLLALLCVPLLFAVGRLYPWTSGIEVEVVRRKAAYLAVPFFVARAACYHVAWSLLAVLLSRAAAVARPALASVGLLVLVVTVGFAAAGVTVHSAGIDTVGGVVIDRFELTDRDGRKLDGDLCHAVRDAIWTGKGAPGAESRRFFRRRDRAGV